ncbi:hypothetical protein [Accumulibacter sp.]|uniref:hypothetical protein n=1 Tax=Accumulibacter sp. TaxID=2053492 RepID=UPI002879FE53|nr:hypothetical protein [Accumulibacter sp.]MDS4053511.1 hypothetical protein [Accumulibacter sp.]HMW81637.1 hypothetical protein [Accumulibacter sp.]HMX68087.1 hypothetical protein [Accumulibacter sp.]HNB66544.1 hypothetical protein [Accumulibacter sp.]HND38130.1 hypothetical protein [Accumulibacter sp.]
MPEDTSRTSSNANKGDLTLDELIRRDARKRDRDCQNEAEMRLGMDCKVTVDIGDDSRGNKTRGDSRSRRRHGMRGETHSIGCHQ